MNKVILISFQNVKLHSFICRLANSQKAKKCENLLNLELEKVVRNGQKVVICPKFQVEGLPAGIMGIGSHVTLTLEL